MPVEGGDCPTEPLARFLEEYLYSTLLKSGPSIEFVHPQQFFSSNNDDGTLQEDLNELRDTDTEAGRIIKRFDFLFSAFPVKALPEKHPLKNIRINFENHSFVFRPDTKQWEKLCSLQERISDSRSLIRLYTGIAALLPRTDFLFDSISIPVLSDLFNVLLQKSGLTIDMLSGLLTAFPAHAAKIYKSLSKNIRDDLDRMRQGNEPPSREWGGMAAHLFRWNILVLLYRDEWKRFYLSNVFSDFRRQMEGLLYSTLKDRLPVFLSRLDRGETGGILAEAGERALTLACTVLNEEQRNLLTEQLPVRKRARILEELPWAAKNETITNRRASVFKIEKALSIALAAQNPYFKKDLLTFLRKNTTAEARIFLILESGINTTVEALRTAGEPVTGEFLAPLPSGQQQLVKDMIDGKIILKNSGYTDSGWRSLNKICTDWKSLEILGIWE